MSLRMLKPFLAVSALFLASQLASAQSKIAVISLQKAVFDTAEIKKADADMQASLKPKKDEADKLTAELNQISNKLQADAGKLTAAAEMQLQNDGKRKQLELQRINEDLEGEANNMRTEILGRASDRMSAIVKKLAEDKGIDMVVAVDTQVALYYKPTLDLTAEATAAYDKQYPVAAAAAAAAPKK